MKNQSKLFWIRKDMNEDYIKQEIIDMIQDDRVKGCTLRFVSASRIDMVLRIISNLQEFFPEEKIRVSHDSK